MNSKCVVITISIFFELFELKSDMPSTINVHHVANYESQTLRVYNIKYSEIKNIMVDLEAALEKRGRGPNFSFDH